MSKHFSEDEFKCKCCQELPAGGIDPRLIAGLERLRALLGNRPLRIVSGYRCKSYNKRVGGAKESQHMLGKAADVQHDDREPYEVADVAESMPEFKGVGRYNTFTHVDVRERKARWSMVR